MAMSKRLVRFDNRRHCAATGSALLQAQDAKVEQHSSGARQAYVGKEAQRSRPESVT
jgi:hypothetical protein